MFQYFYFTFLLRISPSILQKKDILARISCPINYIETISSVFLRYGDSVHFSTIGTGAGLGSSQRTGPVGIPVPILNDLPISNSTIWLPIIVSSLDSYI